MEKDQLYIDNNKRAITVELPEYGEIRLIIQGGKVVIKRQKMAGNRMRNAVKMV